MLNLTEISRAAACRPSRLHEIKHDLIVEKMKLDKFFSVFLDENEMDSDDTSTPEWFTYKEMLKEYDRINRLLKATTYYLARG